MKDALQVVGTNRHLAVQLIAQAIAIQDFCSYVFGSDNWELSLITSTPILVKQNCAHCFLLRQFRKEYADLERGFVSKAFVGIGFGFGQVLNDSRP